MPTQPVPPSPEPTRTLTLNRRRAIGALGSLSGLAIAVPTPARAHVIGPVEPPMPAPALPLRFHDGRTGTLREALTGRPSAVQLMFAGCTTTCPIQGALFANIQDRLARSKGTNPGFRLLSISIDALSDDPAALALWLQRQGARAGWQSAVPSVAGVDTLFDFLKGRSQDADRHTSQVYLFNARAELVMRTPVFPAPELVVAGLRSQSHKI